MTVLGIIEDYHGVFMFDLTMIKTWSKDIERKPRLIGGNDLGQVDQAVLA